jgi:metal-sulfur cluster biosynthetic enzyme
VGDRDLALSLAESLRDTLDFERGQAPDPAPAQLSSDRSMRVDTLPRAWAEWARGWTYVRPIALYETVNLGRTGEPVEAWLEFHPAQLTDPYRELRVAQIHPGTGLLREVPSQVTRTTRTGEVWQCRVLFMADVPAHGEAGYLVFHGNALAELPEYLTDLRVQGEGHDLTISLKEGRMDAVQDVTVEAMRDDEWVFSGYSFTDMLWIDRFGKLREGPVPPGEADRIRGVGLQPGLPRRVPRPLAGARGRGPRHRRRQWSAHAPLPRPRSALEPVPAAPRRAQGGHVDPPAQRVSRLRRRRGARRARRRGLAAASTPPRGSPPGELPRLAKAAREGSLARPGETAETAPLKPAIWRALNEVTDDQLYTLKSGIVDLGYVYDVRVRQGVVHVIVTMPHRGRPVHDFLVTRCGGRVNEGIREPVLKLDGVRDVVVDLTWNPPRTASRLSDAGRRELGL